MIRAASLPCRWPGCRELVKRGERYCSKHKSEKPQTDKMRGVGCSDRRYHQRRWRLLAERKRAMNPLCELCLQRGTYTPADIVHHIQDIQTRPDLMYDIANLQSLCRACHAKEHSYEENFKE